MCLIYDKEIEDKISHTNFYVTNADKYIPKLLNILKIYPEYKLNDESWNISKAVFYIISFIVNSSTDETILNNLLNYSSKYFNSISYEEKINSLLILSCCLESKNMEINFFKNYYKLLINTFIESSSNEENINSGLSFYFLRVIMNAIQFSSYDLQDNLEFFFLIC